MTLPPPLQQRATHPRNQVARTVLALAVATLALLVSAAPAGAATTATDRGILTWTPRIPALSRDCGLSTKLSDGNILWVFCDSFYTSNTGVLHAVQHNTAAFAGPATPTAMADHTFNFFGEYILNADSSAYGGRSFVTLPATPLNFPCDGGVRKAWPKGVTTVPKAGPNGTDKVLIYYSRICDKTQTLGMLSYVQNGMGLAEFDYAAGSFNPAVGPTGPIVATKVVNDNLFGTLTPWGAGAMTSRDNLYVHVYRCSDRYCFAGRVPQGQAGTASSYRWWNGSAWGTSAVAMKMPTDSLPVSQFTVQWVPQANKYVMVYSPCLYTCQLPKLDQLHLRTASNPQGPWTNPVTVFLPNCTTDANQTPCNAAAGHVELDGTNLTVSYSRRNEGLLPQGRVHTATVPLSAVLAAR